MCIRDRLFDIRFKVPYIGELICDMDCPAVEDYNDFAEALELSLIHI